MNSFTCTHTIQYDDEFLMYIVIGALEGGSNFWIGKLFIIPPNHEVKPKGMALSEWAYEVLKMGGKIIFRTNDDDSEEFILTMDILKYGLKKVVELYFAEPNIMLFGYGKGIIFEKDDMTLDAGQFDADLCDAVIQFALFNELVFG